MCRAAFDVKWLPFQLDDSLPAEGVDKVALYNRKFGPARVAAMLPRMQSVFEGVGLSYKCVHSSLPWPTRRRQARCWPRLEAILCHISAAGDELVAVSVPC